jgi:hypothetical protein
MVDSKAMAGLTPNIRNFRASDLMRVIAFLRAALIERNRLRGRMSYKRKAQLQSDEW